MLPPFVPPSARAPQEALPWITQFVVDRKERVFEAGVAVADAVADAAEDTAAAMRALTPPAGVDVALAEVAVAEAPNALPLITEFMADAAVAVPAAEPAPEDATAPLSDDGRPAEASPTEVSPAEAPPAEERPEGAWIDDERDAFDWQSVATLAERQRDDLRATAEWAATAWETSSPDADHAAAVLVHIARRIRAGELSINVTPDSSPAATLAAVLAALLRGDG